MPMIRFLLDHDWESSPQQWPFVPLVGDVLDFGPSTAEIQAGASSPDLFATVASRWYCRADDLWDLTIDSEFDGEFDAQTCAGWRAAGFPIGPPDDDVDDEGEL